MMAVVQPFFSVWRMRVVIEALTTSNETDTHQITIRYAHTTRWVLAWLIQHRASLALATYMPALLGNLIFASEQPWFWKHMIAQYVMGTASTFLSAYTLATLHEVSTIARAAAFHFGSTAHAGCRLVGGREVSKAEALALPLKMALISTGCIRVPSHGGKYSTLTR